MRSWRSPSNIAGMPAPGGAFLHNEQRPVLGEFATALGLPLQQSRHAVIATFGAPRRSTTASSCIESARRWNPPFVSNP